jgi:hypothetical protein
MEVLRYYCDGVFLIATICYHIIHHSFADNDGFLLWAFGIKDSGRYGHVEHLSIGVDNPNMPQMADCIRMISAGVIIVAVF